jgi:hypothetical protein
VSDSGNEDDVEETDVPLPRFMSQDRGPNGAEAAPAGSYTPDRIHAHEECAQGVALQFGDDALLFGDTLPESDVMQWTTKDVIAWLKYHDTDGVMDESMQEAFRAARVSGQSLLNLMPNDLFKRMRKWHRRRAALLRVGRMSGAEGVEAASKLRKEFAVESNLLQETIILSFPYCR